MGEGLGGEELKEVVEVVCVQLVVLGVQAGEGVSCHVFGVEVGNVEVNVVAYAVGQELGCQSLEVGLSAPCIVDVCNGSGGVHPEVDPGILEVCCEGFDGEEG